MDRISAGSNLSIDMEQDHWRLLVNGDGTERVLVEARMGQPLRYVANFGSQRRLPASGTLAVEYVDRVVLGWSNRDESWHLGLMLSPELAQARGSRWCGLAYWPDPDTELYRDIAARAGETLAQRMNRPFTMIPPDASGATPAYAPAYAPSAPSIPPVPLELPIKLDQWTLQRAGDPSQLTLKLSPAWGRSRLVRTAWYIIWAGVFVALSLASLSTEIAPTQPEFLPYAGLVCAAFLVILSFATIIGSIRRVKRIEIDSRTRTIRGMRGGRERWRYSADQLSEVYATLVLTKVTRRKRVQHMHYGEINLHKRDGAFHHVITQGQTDEKVPSPVGVALDAVNAEFVVPQTPQNAFTRLQAATLLIAQALQLPSQYDQRIK